LSTGRDFGIDDTLGFTEGNASAQKNARRGLDAQLPPAPKRSVTVDATVA